MDLREKLRQFESDFRPYREETIPQVNDDMGRFVSGEEISNEYGSFFRSVTFYPENQQHGKISLDLISEIDFDIFGLVGKDQTLSGIDLRKAVFIDTETTGLAGGVGTVPFLVGLGTFIDKGFTIEQFFMRDYNEERAVLEAVKTCLEKCQALVSYNGKCYDINLLSSRFILSRMINPAANLPHLDLLFTARRLWRRRIADCSLLNVEQCILGFERYGDVPSYLIPTLYFEYLRTRNASPLTSVFKHNRWDILTLAALAVYTGQIYQYPQKHLKDPMDFLSLGKALETVFRPEEASKCFREALNYPIKPEDREEALMLLGFSLKRFGQWNRAVQVWEYMTETIPHHIISYEELAKYYEHRVRNFDRAIEIVNRALEQIQITQELHPDLNLNENRRNLEYRLARLRRKLKGKISDPFTKEMK